MKPDRRRVSRGGSGAFLGKRWLRVTRACASAALEADRRAVARQVEHRYRDPVDELWLAAARELGFEVARSPEVFAAYDGAGTLTISAPEHLDLDDCLAQMIFHELCHALVQGPNAARQVDWALGNEGDPEELIAEHATHRLQAALAARHGLRGFMAVTTDHRVYWDALPEDPLADGDDPAIALAQGAWRRLGGEQRDWWRVLERALAGTAHMAQCVRQLAGEESLWRQAEPLHACGLAFHTDPRRRCRDCAWIYRERGRSGAWRCRQPPSPALRRDAGPGQTVGVGPTDARLALEPEARACVRWEPTPDEAACGRCGACCREGFHVVAIGRGDPFATRHPELVARDGRFRFLPRPDGRCVCLSGGGPREPYRCQVYPERPRSCAEFEAGGDACLEARRRVGLSR